MKTVTIGKTIHVITYQCEKSIVCGAPIPENPAFLERKSLWETTCAKCKRILSPLKK